MNMRRFEVVTKFDGLAKLPTRADNKSAGYDFYTMADKVCIYPNSLVYIQTGIKALMPEWEYLQLSLRSGFATKNLCIMPNSPGIIDASYYNNVSNEGHIMVPVMNLSDQLLIIEPYTRIAQGIFLAYYTVENDKVIMEERIGGFGSSKET